MPSDELKRIFSDQNIICKTVKMTVEQNKKIVKFTSLHNFNNKCINILKKKKVVLIMRSLSKQKMI